MKNYREPGETWRTRRNFKNQGKHEEPGENQGKTRGKPGETRRTRGNLENHGNPGEAGETLRTRVNMEKTERTRGEPGKIQGKTRGK